MPRSLVLRPCAKVNLTLEVGEVRADGFHEVRTILQSVLLADRLTFTRRRGPFSLVARAAGVPEDRSNLIWRAAEAVWRAMGRSGDPCDARVTLEKKIPVAAGLGGGSADAAAALVGLSSLWGANFTTATLSELAATLGSDVPFFLHGGTALATGRGEILTTLRDLPRLPVLIAVPAFGISAREAYRWLDADRPKGPHRSSQLLFDIGWAEGWVAVGNDLEEPVTRRHPEIAEIVEACRREGARAPAMTGSGSAVFALLQRPMTTAALGRLRKRQWRVILTRTATHQEASQRIGL